MKSSVFDSCRACLALVEEKPPRHRAASSAAKFGSRRALNLDGAERMPSTLPLTGAGNSQKIKARDVLPQGLLGPVCSASLGNRRMSNYRGAQCTHGGAYTMALRWRRVWHERAGVSSEHMVSLLGVRVSDGHRSQETIAILRWVLSEMAC